MMFDQLQLQQNYPCHPILEPLKNRPKYLEMGTFIRLFRYGRRWRGYHVVVL